jgi:peptidyl-prolyl cis-trans isomerase D
MAEGWKQIWDDIRGAIRGSPPAAVIEPEESGTPPTPVAEAASEAFDIAPNAEAVIAESVTPPTPVPLNLPAPPLLEGPVHRDGMETAPASSAAAEPMAPATFLRCITSNMGIVTITAILTSYLFLRFDGARLVQQWVAPRPPAPDVVATFEGGQITLADLEAHLTLLVPDEYRATLQTPEGLRAVVREMATDELARRWAAEQKVEAQDTFKHTMEHITENVNLDTFQSQLHEGAIAVPESEIQAYYDANRAEFGERTLADAREDIRQRLVGEKEGQYVKDYIARLKENASITRNDMLLDVLPPTEAELREYFGANTEQYTVTAQYTVDELYLPITADEQSARESAEAALRKVSSGDSFGAAGQVTGMQVLTNTVIAAGQRSETWEKAVQQLQADELSEVVRDGNGFAIVSLRAATPTRPMTYEEARPQVLAAVEQRQLEQWMGENGSKTLFTLKGKQYTLGQFYQEYKELPPSTQAQFAGPEGMKRLADQLIERLLLVEDTYDQLLQVENKDEIDQVRLDVLKQMMHQQEIDDAIQVSDEEIQQFYEQNLDLMTPPPRARIRYIRIGLGQTDDERKKAQARADEAYSRLVPPPLQQAIEFADVAKEYSEDTATAANGGEFPDWIGESNDPLEPPEYHALHERVLGMGLNEISPPFELGNSIYIVQLLMRDEPKTITLEEAKPYIKEELTNQKHDEQLVQLQDRLARQVNLVFYDSVLDTYATAAGGSGELQPRPSILPQGATP